MAQRLSMLIMPRLSLVVQCHYSVYLIKYGIVTTNRKRQMKKLGLNVYMLILYLLL